MTWLTDADQESLLQDGPSTLRVRKEVVQAVKDAVEKIEKKFEQGIVKQKEMYDLTLRVYELAEKIETVQRKKIKVDRDIAAKTVGDINALLK